jgi:DNA-binding transcriptional LysR family regulator
MHGMDWDNLQTFLAVARTGRISAAARRLDVEHTTVARRLAVLQRELGVPLFYRTSTGYVLTRHGHNALSQAEVVERAVLAVAARARQDSGVIAGRVRVALPPEFASHWLALHLSAFRERYPDVQLQMLVATRHRDLTRGEAELAVQAPRPRQQGLLAVKIARTSTALYASRALIDDPRWRVSSLESLRGLPLLTYTSAFHMLQEAKWFQPVLAGATVALETNSTHALVAAALAGAGVAVLPGFVARTYCDLVAVSDETAVHDVCLITHPEFRRDPKVRATATFLKEAASGAAGLS